jgi:hypothetical protein
MKLRQAIPTDITASAIAHLSLLALVFVFSEVHPFGSVTAEPIAVDIVTPKEITEPKPEPVSTPTPQPDFSALEKPAEKSAEKPAETNAPAAVAEQPAPARPQKQAALAAQRPAQQPPAASPPQQTVASSAPAYKPPEPDLSIKYQVLLGLPPDISVIPPAAPAAPARASDKADDNFDAPANKSADVASSVVAEFRRHLRTCSKLPASLTPSDDVKVKLRVLMKQDGRLAAEPILIEASASMKGPLLMKGAISALEACQPYAMLPPDRYGEWKVLDLSFTPQDF